MLLASSTSWSNCNRPGTNSSSRSLPLWREYEQPVWLKAKMRNHRLAHSYFLRLCDHCQDHFPIPTVEISAPLFRPLRKGFSTVFKKDLRPITHFQKSAVLAKRDYALNQIQKPYINYECFYFTGVLPSVSNIAHLLQPASFF